MMRYRDLFFAFFRVGLLTFGGGYSMLPILQREAVDKKSWITEAEMLDYYAVAQSLPGIIAVNTALLVGNKIKGRRGGLVAALGVVVPSLVVIMVIAAFLQGYMSNPWVQKAFYGIRIVVCALITQAIVKFWKTAIVDVFCVCMYVAVLALALFTPVPTWAIVLLAVGAGLARYFLLHRRDAS